MTSHPKNRLKRVAPRPTALHSRPARNGFTLLEIVIVLMIVGLVIGGAITTMVVTSSERILRNTSGEIELLAKKARSASILRQTPYVIEFHRNSVKLMPLSDIRYESRPSTSDPDEDGEKTYSSLREEISLDPGLILSIRQWNTENYLVPSETFMPVWRFDPDGLSEPITVRLTMGNSYAQDTYHPLTATITDSEMEAN